MSDPWADSLDEDWISQPRSSPAVVPTLSGTQRSTLSTSGTTRILLESMSTTNRRPSRGSDLPSDAGTENSRLQVDRRGTPEWKRMVMEDFGAPGGKDLFSPMQLECMFRPPTVGPTGGSVLGIPQREQAVQQPEKRPLPVPLRKEQAPRRRLPEEHAPRKQQQPQQQKTPISKYRSSIPIPTSSPRPLIPTPKEEHRLQFTSFHSHRKSTTSLTSAPVVAAASQPRQISKLRQSLGHRKSSSASALPPQPSPEERGKRKTERYLDIDADIRSAMVLPEPENLLVSSENMESTLNQSALSDNLRANERWSSIKIGHDRGPSRSGSDSIHRDENISSIIVDGLKLLKEPLTQESSSPGIGSTLAAHYGVQYSPIGVLGDSEDSEANDTVGEMISAPPTGARDRRRSSLLLEGESSVYPSSPPILSYTALQQGEGPSYLDGSDDYDASYLDGSSAELESPFTSPYKQILSDGSQREQNPMLASPFLPAGQEPSSVSPSKRPAPSLPPQGEMAGAGNSILDNIRRHKDAPKSPVKPYHSLLLTNRRESVSPDEKEDPFFTPQAFRHQISPMPRTPTKSGEQSRTSGAEARSSGSPLKLFASFYDTFTNERLTKRLGELEVSESQSLQVPEKERGESEDFSEQETDVSFSGGSVVVNRLEKLARKQEKAKSPSRHLKVKSRLTLTSASRPVSARPAGAHRHASAPEASSPGRSLADGYRKHRRWRSDETAAGDGVEAPRSPLKERTPKRVRRNRNGVYQHVSRTDNPLPPIPDQTKIAQYLNRARSDTAALRVDAPVTPSRRRVTDGGTPGSTGRGKGRKVPVLKRNYDYGGSIKVSPQQSKSSPLKRGDAIVFSGSKGDGMEGEGFEMPSPVQPETVRKGSVTTQDFLDQADAVMNRIRGRGMRSFASEDDGSYYDEHSIMTSPGRGVGGSPVARSPLRNEVEQRLPRIRVTKHSGVMEGIKEGRSEAGSFDGKQDTVKTQASTSSYRSRASAVEIISPDDGVMEHHLVQRNASEMTFDKSKMAWVKRDPSRSRSLSPEKESSQLLKIDDSDPFVGISDLSVDSQEEARALELARRNWEGMASDGEKSGLWRSSRMISDIDEEDEEDGVGDETWDRQQWLGEESEMEGDAEVDRGRSTVGSGSERSSRSTRPGSGAETRTTSYGSEENKGKAMDRHEGEDDDGEQEVARAGGGKGSEPLRRARNSYAEDYSSPNSAGMLGRTAPSSPADMPVLWSDDGGDTDGGIDGFLEHGSLRQSRRNSSRTFASGGTYRGAARRRSSGAKSFVGRPISRITEEEEEDHLLPSPALRDIQRELNRISLSSALTPLQSPFLSGVSKTNMELSATTRTTRDRRESSFQLTPLADLSYQFETTEALINLELSFFATRRGRSLVGAKAIEESFSIARDNLLKCLTDVEPYEPYWDHMKVLDLSGRKVETLFTLSDWMPRVEELDVSNNELGQLSGVSETVRDLKVMGNCLSGLTHWGHLVNLQYVDVSRNGLENLDGLRGLRHLREIRADDNVIENIDGVLGMSGLGFLRARRNRLVEVDFSKAMMNRLTELDLRGNDIDTVSGIEKLPALINLNLDQNNLESLSIPTGTKLDSIRCIKLTQNYFETFDVSQFPNLRILYMDNNRLRGIEGLTRAKHLDAISTREQEHDGRECTLKFERMYEARKIYLSGNPLRNLGLKLNFLNLQYLELASAQLTTLPKDFGYLVSNTRVLNLNNNAISDLRPLLGIVRLKKLLLVGNRVKSVKKIAAVLGYFPSLSYLDLRMNPLTIGFYPPSSIRKSFSDSDEPDEYPKDPFTMMPGDMMDDRTFQAQLDIDSAVVRRTYEITIGRRCPRMRELDGLEYRKDESMRNDEVFAELRGRGLIKTAENDGNRAVVAPEKKPVSGEVGCGGIN